MKYLISLIVMLLCISTAFSQTPQQPAVIIISSISTPTYISEMKESLKSHGLIFNVEKELWEQSGQLQEFAFTIINQTNKTPKTFNFKYNALNKHQVLLIYPSGNDQYSEVMADVSYLQSDILPLVVSNEVKRMKPVLHRSYGKSGGPYRQSIVLTDLKRLESELSETVKMNKAIRADQIIGKSISGLTYTYNGEYLENPAGINLMDMTSDVLIETLSDDSKIVNIWSDEPLNELITGSTIAGQR